jgi:hypothetical protein
MAAGRGLGQLWTSVFSLVGVQNPLAGQVGQSAVAAQQLATGATAAAGGVGVLVTASVAGVAALALAVASRMPAASAAAIVFWQTT